jgi:D-alanine transaminase
MIVYFNGKFIREDDCRISPFDRGFLFADGVYEVAKYTGNKFFEFDSHLERLKNRLNFLQINYPDTDKLFDISNELIKSNNLNNKDSIVYIQITRGISNPRNHLFPKDNYPTIIANVSELKPESEKDSLKIILTEDLRWSGCNIKTTLLLPNVLALQKAFENGADEAVLVRDGNIMEGTHTSFCAVKDGCVIIPPLSNHILPGITRKVVLNLCKEIDIPVIEKNFTAVELSTFDEFMILSTKSDVVPVKEIYNVVGDASLKHQQRQDVVVDASLKHLKASQQLKSIIKREAGIITKKIQKAFKEYINS